MKTTPTIATKAAKGIILLFAVFVCSCKVQQASTSVTRTDSTQVSIKHDTLHIVIKDTMHTEIVSNTIIYDTTHIVFNDNGGTYNTLTGEIGGIRSIQSSHRHESSASETTTHLQEYNALQSKYDSLFAELKKERIFSEKKSEPQQRSRWAVFCSYYTITTLLLLLIAGVIYAYTKKNAIFAFCRTIFR